MENGNCSILFNSYSMNVRGLRSDIKKRTKIFNMFKTKYCGIICLQETHSIREVKCHNLCNDHFPRMENYPTKIKTSPALTKIPNP